MTGTMIEIAEPPPASGLAESAAEEPPQTGADIMIGDERWEAVPGLIPLIPRLIASALLEAGRCPEAHSVSIALLSGAEVRSLNKDFRGKDAATNVLSFPAAPASAARQSEFGQAAFLGDVALAYEIVAEEAEAQHKPFLHHAAHLAVHGVLHLTGLDHGNDTDAERMESAERAILGQFGIPDPYGDAPCTIPTLQS